MTLRGFRFVSATLLLLLLLSLAAARPGLAQTLPDGFFGHWVGSGIAEDADTLFLGLSQRDLDVRIERRADGTGFIVDWTTVIRAANSGTDEVRRRQTRLALVPAGRDGLFVATETADPLTGGVASWARVTPDGTAFIVYQLLLNADGAPETVRYERQLTAAGMELRFARVRDGSVIREVHGRLTRSD